MRISQYVKNLHDSEEELAKAFKAVSEFHVEEPDVHEMCKLFASWSLDHVQNLTPMQTVYDEGEESEADRIKYSSLTMNTESPGLLRDLCHLWLMTSDVQLGWVILHQCAKALRDEKLKLSCERFGSQTIKQKEWLMMKIKHSAPQILTVAI